MCMIPSFITIKNKELPDHPGVYFYFDENETLLYIGKATSLVRRVGSYFTKAHDGRIAEMVGKIRRIDYIETPTVIEALVLEANQIKAKKPHYNILQRDDKSFLYLTISNELYPKPKLMRGLDLERLGVDPFSRALSASAKKKFLAVYGPYTSGPALRRALELIRGAIPWTTCEPPEVTGKKKACFDAHLKRCPGVCIGAIDPKAYRVIVKNLMAFFEGKKAKILSALKKDMTRAAKAQDFEEAKILRDRVYALEHIRDVAMIMREEPLAYERTKEDELNLTGRIEAYDISNISGTSSVGSMVVFEYGEPAKSLYRKFKIKTVQGPNDFASMEEVLRRRLIKSQTHPASWPLPVIMIIDGGEGQLSKVQSVMDELGIHVPFIGIAKGFDRKQDRLVFDRTDLTLARAATRGKELFQKARDEAHRFAVSYHRVLRRAASGIPNKRRT